MLVCFMTSDRNGKNSNDWVVEKNLEEERNEKAQSEYIGRKNTFATKENIKQKNKN